MKNNIFRLAAITLVVCVVGVGLATAQKAAPRPVIFAVLNDGTSLEPIGYVSKGKLAEPVNGSDADNLIKAFNNTYYKTGAVYKLIFGGASGSSAKVKSSNAKTECARNTANATVTSSKVTLKGLIMGLATNAPIKTTQAVYRRKPTTEEKAEIDALAKSEFLKEKLTAKTLHYQNLTALDPNNDGKADFVASYWIEIDKLTRGLLFFIASRGSDGKYKAGYREYRSVDQANVMGGEIKAVDDGVYHELLIDAFDYDGDGSGEIFTYQQGFEGAGFAAYKRNGTKWSKVYEFNNYHCAY